MLYQQEGQNQEGKKNGGMRHIRFFLLNILNYAFLIDLGLVQFPD